MKSAKQARREAKQLVRLCIVNGLLDKNRTRGVAQRVAAAGSATPVPQDLQAAIQAGLTRRFGPVLNIVTLRPSLIGGVRIQVASDVYDGSVLAALARLEKNL